MNIDTDILSCFYLPHAVYHIDILIVAASLGRIHHMLPSLLYSMLHDLHLVHGFVHYVIVLPALLSSFDAHLRSVSLTLSRHLRTACQ